MEQSASWSLPRNLQNNDDTSILKWLSTCSFQKLNCIANKTSLPLVIEGVALKNINIMRYFIHLEMKIRNNEKQAIQFIGLTTTTSIRRSTKDR